MIKPHKSEQTTLSSSYFYTYGILGLPLAFLGFPLYVFLPKYLTALGLSLSNIALILLITRLIDAIQDPLLGAWCARHGSLKKQSLWAILALGFLIPLMLWLFYLSSSVWMTLVQLVLIYTAYSVCMINYYAVGAALPLTYEKKTTLTTTREGFFLLGVLVFSAMPTLLKSPLEEREFYEQLALILGLITGMALAIYYFFHTQLPERIYKPINNLKPLSMVEIFKNRSFLTIACLFFLSIFAASMPGSLFIFYVKNILKASDDHVGYFLGTYFLSGILGMPLWNYLSQNHGRLFSKRVLWILGALLSIFSFIWAFFLSAQNFLAFYAICVGSGLALGLDLALPPAILADYIAKTQNTAVFFGVWTFINKFAMSLGASGALYLVSLFGFKEGFVLTHGSHWSLPFTYAIIPCIVKGIFLLLLLRFKWVGVKSV